jgi:glycosyltransferase involved in cell wall biosynthesis
VNRSLPRRILFVVGSFTFGGAERQLAMLAGRLVARGWTVSVMGLEKDGPLIEVLERSGIKVLDGGYRHSARYLRFPRLMLCAARLITSALTMRPTVLHGFLPIPNFLGAVAARIAFVPLVVTSKRGLGTHQDRHPHQRWTDRAANALSDIITANSSAVADDAQLREGYDVSRIVVIPNGLDFASFDNLQQHRDRVRQELGLLASDVAIVCVANLIPYKGHRELIDAFARVASTDGRLKLFLIGEDRGIAADLSSQAVGLDMTGRIAFLGRRSDVPRLLSAMDVGVVPSHEEGLSNALLEKLAAGLPVAATNIGGNPEALEGMPGCVLVRPRDAEDLAQGLRGIISVHGVNDCSPLMRRRLVRDRYSVDAMVDAYEQLYSRAWQLPAG